MKNISENKNAHNQQSLSTFSRKALPKLNRDNTKYAIVFILTFAVLVIAFLTSLAVGRYSIPLSDVIKIISSKLLPMAQYGENIENAVIFNLRLPRTVVAVIIGGALALSGATYQSIFKNPMCSPDLLGVSSGACVGAASAILLGMGSGMIQVFAFVGGILTVALTVTIPKLMRNESTTILILSGIVVGNLMSSIMSIIKFVADTDTELAEITYWMMGSFATVKFEEMLPVLPSILIPVALILLMRYRLNVLSLGDNESRSLGINLQKTRGIFIICSTLISASCVCLAGTIGWVGLVIPHVARMLIGSDNKKMLPVAVLLGGAFMLVIDILCRTLTPAELKIGILTGIIGAPFFILILIKQNRNLT